MDDHMYNAMISHTECELISIFRKEYKKYEKISANLFIKK